MTGMNGAAGLKGVNQRKEITALQFGTGRFLRAFADLFFSQAEARGLAPGRVALVESTGAGRTGLIRERGGEWHVLVRGLAGGEVIDTVETVSSAGTAFSVGADWEQILETAALPSLRWVLSNTTEVGIALDPEDRPEDRPPGSFPARLLRLLLHRHTAGLPGLAILPCELVERNGKRLRDLTLQQAELWHTDPGAMEWLREDCSWHCTLVDRIVTAGPAAHPLRQTDPLLACAEPFALWAIEGDPAAPPLFPHEAILTTPDIRPYALRKLRLLNGTHTALVGLAAPYGYVTVAEALQNTEIRQALEEMLFEEIVPILDGVEGAAEFAAQTLERLQNPFLDHRLADIAANHALKQQIRLVPSLEEYRNRFGREPARLAAAVGFRG